MALEAAAQLLATALLLLQAVSANPSLPQSVRDNAQVVAEQAITEATRAIAKPSVGGGASCTIVSDKPNHYLGEVLVFDWKTMNAAKAEFVPDTSWKDNLPVPEGELLGTTGQYRKVALARGYPFLTIKVTGARGESATCSKMVFVY